MNEATKSQLIEELNKAIKPEKDVENVDDGRVQFRQSTHTLEINEEARIASEDEQAQVKKPNEDEMFESLIRQLNEQKYGFDKKKDYV